MSWDEARRAFEEKIPGFRERKPQSDLAHAVEKALGTGTPILAQAPPGTGKSYVAIIELLDQARQSGQPCVAATATKALQDQYIADCEQIRRVYEPTFRFTVLKGRGNYLCRAKMAKADEVLLGVNIDDLTRVAEKDEVLGDVERLGEAELTPTQRRELTTTSDECPGKTKCKFGKICFAEAAKERAANSDVIVVSHALLATDATLKADGVALLPAFPALVVDEAHELRGYVEGALSAEITHRGLTTLVTEVVNFTGDAELNRLGEFAITALFSKFDAILSRKQQETITPSILVECEAQLTSLIDFVDTLEGKVAAVKVYDDDENTRKTRLKKRCNTAGNKLRHVVVDDFASTVRWIERDQPNARGYSKGVMLCTAPLDVSQFLANAIWSQTTPVLMSATLAITDKSGKTDFDFMAKEQGIDLTGRYETFVGPTPFHFESQARTYIPEHIPDARRDLGQWRSVFLNECRELIRAADGRTMLLFTSWKELNEAYRTLAPWIQESLGHRVFKQGEMGSTRALADAFAADEHSVLFGTKSFFTGVNVEGSSLSCLIIAKLPFHYPDPLWQARCESVDAKCNEATKWTKGSFPTLQVPDMIMTLQQGYGRLIRTVADHGLVAIFDSSITLRSGKAYGKQKVRPALPPAPIISELKDATDYLRSLDHEPALTS